MHVTEESHCGIVAMSHSNKEGISWAESEEEKLRINLLKTRYLPALAPKSAGCREIFPQA